MTRLITRLITGHTMIFYWYGYACGVAAAVLWNLGVRILRTRQVWA